MPIGLLKSRLGCWAHERWRAELVLGAPGLAAKMGLRWTDLRNRHEVVTAHEGDARACEWDDSSLLTVARVFPRVGARLLGHCLREWPVRLTTDPSSLSGDTAPMLSVVVPVGGADRVDAFAGTLASLMGQTLRALQIIVVEQGDTPRYADLCPPGIVYQFIERPAGSPFNKSIAANEGVRRATAAYVLIHDADVVVGSTYASSVVERLESGWDAVRPIRFLFDLGQTESCTFCASGGAERPAEVEFVQQNNPGLSTAVRRDTYWEIGGHDERFEGWGGEDAEFLDRLRTTRLMPGAYAPAVHLWHPSAPKKLSGDRNLELSARVRALPPETRIAALRRETCAR